MTMSSEIDYKLPPKVISKCLLPFVDPARLYLNIASESRLDPAVYNDETLEQILEIIKRACTLVVSHASKKLMSGLCGVLSSMVPLVRRAAVPDYWMVTLTDYLLKVLFSSATMTQLSCAQLLSTILSAYPEQSGPIIDEIISNLPGLTQDPNRALTSKSKKILGADYNVSSTVSIKFCSFLILEIVQNNLHAEKAVKGQGRVDFTEVLNVFHSSMSLMEYFVNNVVKKCWKGNSESADYKICFEHFIEDLLKVLYLPEFPFAHKFLGYISMRFFEILSKQSHSYIIRQFAIDKLAVVAKKLAED